MKIVVCVKQVPDTKGGVKFNPDGTLDRGAMLTIMNPDDKAGLEAALRIKDEYGAEVTVLTMGLPKAADVLQEAIATFWLVFAIKAACGAFPLGTFGVFLVIVSCGTTFGGLTGYAMNAARDTAPRLAFAILPIKGKGDADWAYGLTAPLIGPFIGALVAVALYAVIPWM